MTERGASTYADAIMGEKDVIIEFYPQGRYVKVSAMDPCTLTEVAIVGDPASGEEELRRIVLQKLDYVLERNGHRPRGR